ncbi:DUF3667 domain-containing protein [Inhella proteolytica]|uniref:DUF3667 domain-containing protein n=1 Tax=Inhella proteolytica TaxID=2795029 RepID=A0A931NGB5_9BURK|nr:DUF3667 domain-containing protein [Inhella proteolytica]MBH9575300.1 DUF3667 domain-containing protein [Inhella proteolytica]
MNSRHCLNCQAPLPSPFCGQCGQSAKVHRFTLAGLLHDVPHAVFHVERGILATLAGLLRRPGVTINAYLDGQRVRFFNPLSLLVLMAGAYAALYNQPFLLSILEPLFDDSRARGHITGMLGWTTRWYSVLLLLSVPLMGGLNWLFYRQQGRNVAEHMVIMAFTNAVSTLLMILPLYPLLLALHWSGWAGAQRWMGMAWLAVAFITLAYQGWAVAQVFAQQKGTGLRGGGSMLLMCLLAGGVGVLGGVLAMR